MKIKSYFWNATITKSEKKIIDLCLTIEKNWYCVRIVLYLFVFLRLVTQWLKVIVGKGGKKKVSKVQILTVAPHPSCSSSHPLVIWVKCYLETSALWQTNHLTLCSHQWCRNHQPGHCRSIPPWKPRLGSFSNRACAKIVREKNLTSLYCFMIGV